MKASKASTRTCRLSIYREEINSKNFMEVDGASIPVDMDGEQATSG
jgi:hypothetical protein